MIHPSYYELIDRINEEQGTEDSPVVTSRYSIVLAASKRARQLVNGAMPKVKENGSGKLLSLAVEELYEGAVRILPDDWVEEPSEEEMTIEDIAAEETNEDDGNQEEAFEESLDVEDSSDEEPISEDAVEEITEN